jgi:DNA primase
VRLLAQRFGMSLPELEQDDEQRANAAEREDLLKVHDAAAAWFREQLASTAGAPIRAMIAERGILDTTSTALGLGFAPRARDGLLQAMTRAGYSTALLLRAGLVVQRDDGSVADRFRHRLMIPIHRETGSVIAFGGRAVDSDRGPKYLNSPETPIYSKSRTLYGLNLSKAAIRQSGFAVLVEGYFDFAQVYQAGVQAVVASCGTALTPQQAQHLRRFTGRVVLSFDPDAAGEGAAARSCEMLVSEGFDVNVATLPRGEDPDTYVRTHGGRAYGELLKRSRPYLEFLLERVGARHNLNTDEGRVRFLGEMLPIAARIPDATMRDRFGDRLAFAARVTDEVVRSAIRKAAVQKQTALPRAQTPAFGQVTKAEKGLIWSLVHQSEPALEALATLEDTDLEGLPSRSVLDLARKLNQNRGFSPSALLERLSIGEAQLVTAVASEPEAPTLAVGSCVRELRRARYERERAAIQREIDRLQSSGASGAIEMNTLLARNGDLGRLIQALVIAEE